ncbi:MAG: SusC/RagA family TonB-linked outer membrane protein, partial [Ferruginibacter sp.]
SFSIKAQNFSVSGKVTDDAGKALDGATVSEKGTKNSTSTNREGVFQINLSSGKATLVISYVGFELKEISVNSQSQLSVLLKATSESLTDVVVVGYGTRKKADVTGAVASISGDKLRSVPSTNLTSALQGRVPGVEVAASSFRPGAGSRIRIRGNRSLTASNEPLYVVNGVPVNYTIDDMNPADIESVDILKDASSTAIYGSRGANGVVQITTKKGKAGKVTVQYEGSTSYDNILKHLPVYNSVQLADAWRQALYNDTIYNFAQTKQGNAGNNYFPNAAADAKLFGGSIGNASVWNSIKDAYQFTTFDRTTNTYIAVKRATTPEERTLLANLGLPVLTEVDAYDPSKIKSFDWQNAFIRQGTTTSHNINISIGSDKVRSSFGGAYFKQKGIEYGQDYVRYSVSNNTEYKAAKFFTLGSSISYNNSIQNSPASIYGNVSGQLPFTEPYDSTGKFKLYPNTADLQIISAANNDGRVLNETKVNRVFGNIYAEINLYKGLKYKTVFGIDYRNASNGTFNGTNTSANQSTQASAGINQVNSMSWTYDNILTYDTKIKQDHAINVTLLQEVQASKTNQLSVSASNLIFEQQKWYSLQQNSAGVTTSTGSYSAQQLLSYMGRIEYGFKNKYLLTVSNRYDVASVLAEGKQGEYYPSASVAWRLDNEQFFQNQKIFNAAKIRFGVGNVGNSAIDPYQTNGPLTPTLYNWGNGNAAIGQGPTTFKVPQLTWEKTTTKNLGIEFSLLHNRINASIDFYKSSTKDVLQRMTIPATNGVTFMLVNLGEVSNKGIDVALNTVNLNTKSGIRWTTDFVFSKNKEAIVSIDGRSTNLVNLWFVGQPIQVYYSYRSNGNFQYSDTLPGGALARFRGKSGYDKNLFRPGRVNVVDINGDSVITADDKQILGSHNAKWTASITNSVSYKNFELNFNIYFRIGGMYRIPRSGPVARYQGSLADYWTPTNPSNEHQQLTKQSDVPTFWEASGYRNGTYARVRNISLTYKLPQVILTKLKATSLAFYVNAVNPFLFHNKSPYDPETIQYTEQFAATTGNPGPNSYSFRSVVVGVKLGL